jgi:hypothetical protein
MKAKNELPARRKRGGQAGNKNALKTGRHSGEVLREMEEVEWFIKEAYHCLTL